MGKGSFVQNGEEKQQCVIFGTQYYISFLMIFFICIFLFLLVDFIFIYLIYVELITKDSIAIDFTHSDLEYMFI